jgi:hypothetical protein
MLSAPKAPRAIQLETGLSHRNDKAPLGTAVFSVPAAICRRGVSLLQMASRLPGKGSIPSLQGDQLKVVIPRLGPIRDRLVRLAELARFDFCSASQCRASS